MLAALPGAPVPVRARRFSLPAGGRSAVRFAGIAAPVQFVRCPEVVALLPAIFGGWAFGVVEHGRPIITVTGMRRGYRIAAPWLDEGLLVETPVGAVCRLIVDLARATIETDRALLGLHCGTIEIGGRLVVFPSTWRAGKSTLVAGLAARNLRVFADDILGIDAAGRGVATGVTPRLRLPLPPGVARALAPLTACHAGPSDARYLYLDLPAHLLAPRGTAAPIGAFVLLDRQARSGPSLEAVDPGVMLRHVVPRNFAHGPGAEAVLTRLRAIVASAGCYRLCYADLGRASSFLAGAFHSGAPDAGGKPAQAPGADGGPQPSPPARPLSRRRAFTARPGVAITALGDDTFLADGRSGAILALNPAGAAIWRLVASGPVTIEAVARLLAEAFPDQTPEQIAEDVASLFARLAAAGFLRG